MSDSEIVTRPCLVSTTHSVSSQERRNPTASEKPSEKPFSIRRRTTIRVPSSALDTKRAALAIIGPTLSKRPGTYSASALRSFRAGAARLGDIVDSNDGDTVAGPRPQTPRFRRCVNPTRPSQVRGDPRSEFFTDFPALATGEPFGQRAGNASMQRPQIVEQLGKCRPIAGSKSNPRRVSRCTKAQL